MKPIDIKSLLIACLLAVVIIGCADGAAKESSPWRDTPPPAATQIGRYVEFGAWDRKPLILDTSTGDFYQLEGGELKPYAGFTKKGKWMKVGSFE